MQKFILLYKGPVTSPDASHAGWPEWFQKLGEKLVDRGQPLSNGFSMQNEGTVVEPAILLNGYTIVQAENRDEVKILLKDHPYLVLGKEYTIEVFELPQP